MKKIKILLIVIISIFFINVDCFAKVKTYTRTEKDYLVSSDIKVDESNKKAILNTPAISSYEKIYDFAGYLNDNQISELKNKVDDFIDKSNMDFVIVTTSDLNGFSTSDFTNNFYKYNDFKRDGVIFVIYSGVKEPEIYMLAFGKASKIYTDSEIGDTLAYVYPNINNKKYNDALTDYIKIIDGFYDLQDDSWGSYKVDDKGNLIKSIPWIAIVVLAIALTFVIISIFMFMIKKRNKNASNTINIGNKVDNSTLSIKCDNDIPYIEKSNDNNVENK